MIILAIESSCDETAAAVVRDGREVLSSVVSTQIDIHRLYGGVVPEIASRKHTESISWVTQEAILKSGLSAGELDAIAVTFAPGLIGALLVGVNFAKGLSYSLSLPLIPVHHIRAHVASNYVGTSFEPPFLCLIVSGGHSHIVHVKDYTSFEIIGRTRDDAAGEAFDKVARVLELPYPGGVEIDKLSKMGNKEAIHFPKVHFKDAPFDFSFSGVKTAVLNYVHNAKQKGEVINPADVAASFNEAVSSVLCDHFLSAAEELKINRLAVCGGVAANSRLREMLNERIKNRELFINIPSISLCGDNAAMVGAQGYFEILEGNIANLNLNALANLPISYDRKDIM